MNPMWVALGVIVAALITGIVTWKIAKRTKSGKIDTSEAATLWAEGTTMRNELRTAAVKLESQVASLTNQLTAAIAAVTSLNLSVEKARGETALAQAETRRGREEISKLMVQLKAVNEKVETFNTLTLGALADNTETRRILALPKEDRTPVEFDHLATAGERQPEGEHPPIPANELREGDVQIEMEPLKKESSDE